MFKTVDIGSVRNEKLARKYNALVRFANSTKKAKTVKSGALNFELRDLQYVQDPSYSLRPKPEKIVIKWGECTTKIEEANAVTIDRKLKLICIE